MLNDLRYRRLGPLLERLAGGPPRFHPDRITDADFRAHFMHATDTIGRWLGPQLDMHRARLLDFGCGEGKTTLGVALRLAPAELVGLDIHDAYRKLANYAPAQLGLGRFPGNLRFRTTAPADTPPGIGRFDGIYTWSVFEHVDPAILPRVAAQLRDLLRDDGVLFLQIEPLFHSPHGSHLANLVPENWAHLLVDHEELRRRVLEYPGEVPQEYEGNRPLERREYLEFRWREYCRLNRLTADDVIAAFRAAGLDIIDEHRGRLPLEPPAELLRRYSGDVLVNNELIFIARKSRHAGDAE